MSSIFFEHRDFQAVDVKSLIKAENEGVQIAPKMKSYYKYHTWGFQKCKNHQKIPTGRPYCPKIAAMKKDSWQAFFSYLSNDMFCTVWIAETMRNYHNSRTQPIRPRFVMLMLDWVH